MRLRQEKGRPRHLLADDGRRSENARYYPASTRGPFSDGSTLHFLPAAKISVYQEVAGQECIGKNKRNSRKMNVCALDRPGFIGSPSRCAGPSLRAIQIDGRPVRVKAIRHEVGAGKTVLRNDSILIAIAVRAHPVAVSFGDCSPLIAFGIEPIQNQGFNHSLGIRQVSGAVIFKRLKESHVKAVSPLQCLGLFRVLR
jgi:hypothetical protein